MASVKLRKTGIPKSFTEEKVYESRQLKDSKQQHGHEFKHHKYDSNIPDSLNFVLKRPKATQSTRTTGWSSFNERGETRRLFGRG